MMFHQSFFFSVFVVTLPIQTLSKSHPSVSDVIDSLVKKKESKFQEECTVILGDNMKLQDIHSGSFINQNDKPREEETLGEVEDTEISCLTESGMIYTIETEDDKGWMKKMMKDKKLKSGFSKMKTLKSAFVDVGRQTLKFRKTDVEFTIDRVTTLIKGRNSEHSRTTGTRSVLVVRVVLKDGEPTSCEEELGNSVFGNGVENTLTLTSQYSACSHGLLSLQKATNRVGLSKSINNGVVTVELDTVSIHDNHVRIRNQVTAELNRQFDVTNPSELADHVMYCLPPGSMPIVAYGAVNSFLSVYLNDWCTYPSSQMHEIGHNLGFGHSNSPSGLYTDRTDVMGYSFAQRGGPYLCLNPVNVMRGKYCGHKHLDLEEDSSTKKLSFYGRIQNFNFDPDIASHPLILRINTNSTVSYFLGFNGLTQSTRGTKTPNKVLLYRNDDIDLPGSDTELIASLDTGCVHTVENYKGTETDLSISVSQIDFDSGTALVTVKAGYTPSPSLSPSKYHSSTPSAQPSINSNMLLHDNHNPFCTNHPPAWHDADGVAYNCDWYGSEQGRCDLYGSSYANFNATASEACCICGGGISTNNNPSVTSVAEATVPTTFENDWGDQGMAYVCRNEPEGWHDSDGSAYTCEWYQHEGRCSIYGHSHRNFNKTANEACCVCGGGHSFAQSDTSVETPVSLQSPSAPTSSQSVEMICEDTHPFWHDADGETYTCEWYGSGSRCSEYGHGHSNFGFTANEACCSCGGGSLRELNQVICEDSPTNWHDSDGEQYDCQWYSQEDRCTKYGHSYSNFGKTAQEACCSCNGGQVSNPMLNEVTTSPTAAIPTCEDRVPNWHDADGVAYTCEWYSEGTGSRCQSYGDGYANFGFTASENCCGCGGGEEEERGQQPATPNARLQARRNTNQPFGNLYWFSSSLVENHNLTK